MANERRIVADNVKRVLLKEYLMKETQRAGFGGVDIQRTPMGTRVTLIAERPGLIIGRKGESIKNLTDAVDKHFQFNNPQIEVQEDENPSLNAQIMAEKLANALERGWHFRRAGHSTIRRIMEAGAKGCLIIIAGKLTSQRHRVQKFKAGHIKYCGEPRNIFMRKGYAVAKLKPGILGVTVEIMDPDAKLPDEISVKDLEEVAVTSEEPQPQVLAEGYEEKAPEPAVSSPTEEATPVATTPKIVEIKAEDSVKKEKVKTSKVAEKRLKKVMKEAKDLSTEVDIDDTDKKKKKEGAP